MVTNEITEVFEPVWVVEVDQVWVKIANWGLLLPIDTGLIEDGQGEFVGVVGEGHQEIFCGGPPPHPAKGDYFSPLTPVFPLHLPGGNTVVKRGKK